MTSASVVFVSSPPSRRGIEDRYTMIAIFVPGVDAIVFVDDDGSLTMEGYNVAEKQVILARYQDDSLYYLDPKVFGETLSTIAKRYRDNSDWYEVI